jgi:uncharacterized protein (DUF2141 family)
MRSTLLALVLLVSLATADAATVIVNVEGVESSSGEVNVGLCDKSLSPDGCPFSAERPATAGRMEFKFENIPPGRYAVASYHDVNGNEEFDRLLGVPREPFGISNDGGGGLWPEFDGAAVRVGEGETKISIRLKRVFGK